MALHLKSVLTMVILLTAAGATGPAIAGAATTAPSAPSTAGCHSLHASGKSDKQATTALANYINTLREEGMTPDQVEAGLASTYCIVRIDHSDGTVSAASSVNSDVKSRPPTIDYDNQAHLYYAIAYWDWQNTNFLDDGFNPFSPYTKNLGGTDGFAVTFNTGLLMSGWSASWSGNGCHYGSGGTSTAATGDQYGAGFKFQDQDYLNNCVGFNVYHGQEVISFTHTQTKTCKSVQGFSNYGHSWSTTSLSGFSIGVYSIGFSWTSAGHDWASQSQPGGVATVC